MNSGSLYDFQLEYTFADDRLAELNRQLVLLLSTVEGTMPLERELGLNTNFMDKPPEVAKSLYAAEVTRKVATFIPWVRVKRVTWDPAEGGILTSRVVITSA